MTYAPSPSPRLLGRASAMLQRPQIAPGPLRWIGTWVAERPLTRRQGPKVMPVVHRDEGASWGGSVLRSAVSQVNLRGTHVHPDVPRNTHNLVIASGAKRPDRREEVPLGCNLIAVRPDAAAQSMA